jgi:hypothetical protein
VTAGLLLAFTPFIAFAQSGVWGTRGISQRFVVRGNLVFAADGRGVAVYDVAGMTIRRVAVAETSSESLDLTLFSDSDLFVATRGAIERFAVTSDGSLTAVANYPDVTSTLASNGRYLAATTSTGVAVWQPSSQALSIVARFPQPASALAWHGDTLFAGVPGVGLYLFDITGSREPMVLAENARDLSIVGNTLYVAAGVNGLVIYDVTDDGAPRLLSRTAAGETNLGRIAVADGRAIGVELPNKVHVFDITSPSPVRTMTLIEPAQAIAASGTRLFVSGTTFDRFGLPSETGAPLRVFDVTDAAAPRLAREFRDLAGPVSGVATDGTLAYVVDRPYFRVIDISTTASPRELSSLPIDDIGDRVKISDLRAIVYGRGDVQLIDISNPYVPRLVNVFHALGGPPSTAAFARDTILEGNPFSGFHVIDFTHFAEPAQIGGIKGHYHDVVANGGDFAYAVQEASAFVTVDLADTRNPQPVKSITLGAVRLAMTNRSLVVQTLSNIRVFTLDDPRNPVENSVFVTPADAIAADGETAYLATAGLMQTMDLTNPASPRLSSTAIHPLAPMQIAAAKGKIVIADRFALRVFGPNTPPPPPPGRRRPAPHRNSS